MKPPVQVVPNGLESDREGWAQLKPSRVRGIDPELWEGGDANRI
jgi:hypothetical protein